MDKINKALLRLPDKQRQLLLAAFARVVAGNTDGLDIKKLRGHSDLYRLRVGDSRLVYRVEPSMEPVVVFVGKRDDQTYRDF